MMEKVLLVKKQVLNFKLIFMKNILLFVFLILSFKTSGQYIMKKVETNIGNYGYGKLNNDKIVFLGIDDSSQEICLYFKSLKNESEEKKIIQNVSSPPLGWLNDSIILFSDQNNTINGFNINSNIIDYKFKDSQKLFSADNTVISKEEVIYYPSYFKDKSLNNYKYNLITGKKSVIESLSGKELTKVSYNKVGNVLAFTWYNRENKKTYLSMLTSNGNLVNIEEYLEHSISEESPLTLTEKSDKIYYVNKVGDKFILNQYEIESGKKTLIFKFDVGIKCLDLSHSNNKLLLTLEGMNSNDNVFKQKITTEKYNADLSIEVNLGMYIIEGL